MPYNKGYEEADAEAQGGEPQHNDPSHNDRLDASAAAAGSGPDESTRLQQEMDTYFSDEKILIPENEKVSLALIRTPISVLPSINQHVICPQSDLDPGIVDTIPTRD